MGGDWGPDNPHLERAGGAPGGVPVRGDISNDGRGAHQGAKFKLGY